MICRQVQSHLDDYIDNQIDQRLINQIDNHLKKCSDCSQLLESNKQLFSALKSITTPDPGDNYWRQMENSILSRTVAAERNHQEPTELTEIKPINILQNYLIPLAASFILLFGSIFATDLIRNPIYNSPPSANSSFTNNLSENGPEYAGESDSQIFTAIVAGAPGSIGRHLVFADIAGGSR